MADPSKQIDLGGMTLIVDDIKVNATAPGQAGEDIPGDTSDPVFDSLTLGTLSIDATVGAATAAGGDAATAGATPVIPIDINGTHYYPRLTDANA